MRLYQLQVPQLLGVRPEAACFAVRKAHCDHGSRIGVLGAENLGQIVELGEKIATIVWDIEKELGRLGVETVNDSIEQIRNPAACSRRDEYRFRVHRPESRQPGRVDSVRFVEHDHLIDVIRTDLVEDRSHRLHLMVGVSIGSINHMYEKLSISDLFECRLEGLNDLVW